MFKNLLMVATICCVSVWPAQAKPARTRLTRPNFLATFSNPLKADGADPWMTFYKGFYYLTTTTKGDIKMRRARRIADLKEAVDVSIFRDETPGRPGDIWASEFHLLDAGDGPRWYLYYAAALPGNEAERRLFVAQSAGEDPSGPYTLRAQLQTDAADEHFAIDGTVLKLPNGALYCLWCGGPSPAGQGLYIAKMSNPWTIDGPRTYIEASGFGCPSIREAPQVLQRGGKIYLTYSMCGASTPDYRLGMLVAEANSDLLDPRAWRQHPELMLARVDQRGVYGPGHNFFFKSPDGTEDWIVYHAKTTSTDSYDDRTTRAQKITWNADGTPEFGLPLSTATNVPVPSGEAN
jgi:GH43 family beta-xylosidase